MSLGFDLCVTYVHIQTRNSESDAGKTESPFWLYLLLFCPGVLNCHPHLTIVVDHPRLVNIVFSHTLFCCGDVHHQHSSDGDLIQR